jgi:polynucleotide 5'-kinase involved in rRNA processing
MMTAANAEFSSHSSYNFTQFLQYCFALETSRCMGFANFANSAKQLLSKAIKVAVIGPTGVGKSTLIQTFLQVGGGGQLAGNASVGSSPVSAPGSGGAFESVVSHTRSNTYTGGISPARSRNRYIRAAAKECILESLGIIKWEEEDDITMNTKGDL